MWRTVQIAVMAIVLASLPIMATESAWKAVNDEGHKSQTATKDPYLSGALLGTFVGLGAGHYKQGRYLELGWVFTLTEPIAIAGIVFGLKGLFEHNPNPTLASIAPTLLACSAVSLAGLKAWEMTDLWVTQQSYVPAVPKEKRVNPLSFFEPRRPMEFSIPVFKWAF